MHLHIDYKENTFHKEIVIQIVIMHRNDVMNAHRSNNNDNIQFNLLIN